MTKINPTPTCGIIIFGCFLPYMTRLNVFLTPEKEIRIAFLNRLAIVSVIQFFIAFYPY